MKLSIVFFSLITAMQASAENIVDVYGVNADESATILHKYGTRVTDIIIPLNKAGQTLKPGPYVPENVLQLAKKREALIQEIKKKEGLSFVVFDEVMYPNNKNHYITIDVVKNSDKNRLRFVTDEDLKKVYPKTHDIMDKMTEYTDKMFHLMLNNQLNTQNMVCPAYHCTGGFDHPELKPYLAAFNQLNLDEKKRIITTLNHDENPTRRASAAFLVGHFKDPREIITTLLPHVNDPDETVRNNTIRVIGATLERAKINDIDATPFLTLLDSPSLTDRNKSLYVLFAISQSNAGKQLLIQKGSAPLLALLQLKQPNNHDIAYRILKQLSGKDLGEYNLAAWQAWFKQAQSTSV